MPLIPIYIQDFSPGFSDLRITRLGLYGGARGLYGSFAGKATEGVVGGPFPHFLRRATVLTGGLVKGSRL